jgi:hypothetical protein
MEESKITHFSTLKMNAVSSFETLVPIYEFLLRHISRNCNFNFHYRKNGKYCSKPILTLD